MATLEEQVKELTERLEKVERQLGVAPLKGLLADFKTMMENFDNRTLEYIFQGEGDGELAMALMGQEKAVLENAKRALSKTRWKRIYGAMEDLTVEGVSKDWVEAKQENLQRKIQKLEQMGDIVVAGMYDDHELLAGTPWTGKWEEKPKMDLREWKAKVLDSLAG